MSNTTRTQIPAEVNNFYDRTMLMRAVPLLLHTKFAQVRDIPNKSGTDTIKFRRYTNLTAATTALSEGITPAGSSLSITDITATVLQYGDFITLTDVVTFETPDPILTETSQLLGDQAGDTLDQLCRNIVVAGTNVMFATGTERNDITAAAKLTSTLVRKAVRTLKRAKAKRITRMINASTGISTEPVAASYIGIVHPNTTYDLKTDSLFVPIEKYSSNTTAMEGEIGKIDEVRFIESTNAVVFTGEGDGNVDVYGTIIFGQEAYGISRISGQAMQNIVKPLGSGGSSDPLDQRQTSGWKATFVAKILNNDFIIRIEHGVTA